MPVSRLSGPVDRRSFVVLRLVDARAPEQAFLVQEHLRARGQAQETGPRLEIAGAANVVTP